MELELNGEGDEAARIAPSFLPCGCGCGERDRDFTLSGQAQVEMTVCDDEKLHRIQTLFRHRLLEVLWYRSVFNTNHRGDGQASSSKGGHA